MALNLASLYWCRLSSDICTGTVYEYPVASLLCHGALHLGGANSPSSKGEHCHPTFFTLALKAFVSVLEISSLVISLTSSVPLSSEPLPPVPEPPLAGNEFEALWCLAV